MMPPEPHDLFFGCGCHAWSPRDARRPTDRDADRFGLWIVVGGMAIMPLVHAGSSMRPRLFGVSRITVFWLGVQRGALGLPALAGFGQRRRSHRLNPAFEGNQRAAKELGGR